MSISAPSLAPAPASRTPQPAGGRVVALDVLRGLVMTLMLAEVLHLAAVAHSHPGSTIWEWIAFNTSHVQWYGCSLHDLIQPGFSFLVGAALPFSLASRRARGQNFGQLLRHSAWRAIVLIVLGIVLRSISRGAPNFTFEDTLTQIGLGYVFLFLLGWVSWRAQVAALVLVLIGYWAAFALYPAPGANFPYAAVGVPTDWPFHAPGFLSHWNKNSNLAWAFDTWFLNLFPRPKTFLFNGGGYATLSFIPTLGTMILGLLTGRWLQTAEPPKRKLTGMVGAGVVLIVAGLLWQASGTCPIVKRIWTPAFTLYSGGLVLLMLSTIYAITEWRGHRRWAFPLMVVGMNSIAAYLMSGLLEGPLLRALNAASLSDPLLRGSVVLALFWLILYAMYRQRLFLRI